MAEALSRLPPRRLHLVCGMLNTKDVEGFLRPLTAEARDPGSRILICGSLYLAGQVLRANG